MSASEAPDPAYLAALADQSSRADLEIGDYLRDASVNSYAPYANYTEAQLHLWQLTPPLISKRKLQLLLLLLRDPLFRLEDVPASTGRFAKLDQILGTDAKSFTSSVLTVHRRSTAPIPAKTQVSAAPRTRLKQVEVPYADLKTKIHRLCNDPIRRCVWWFRAGRVLILVCPGSPFLNFRGCLAPGEQNTGQFWQTPFAQQPLLFAENSCFWQLGCEFRIGCSAVVDDNSLVVVEGLRYQRCEMKRLDSNCKPQLVVDCARLVPSGSLPAGVAVPVPLSIADHVRLLPTVAIPASRFVRLAAPDIVCAWTASRLPVDGKRAPAWDVQRYQPQRRLFQFRAVVENRPHLHFAVFADGFTSRASRAHCTKGIYAKCLSLPKEHQDRRDNHMMLALVPPGVSEHEAFATVRQQFRELEAGIPFDWLNGSILPPTMAASLSLFAGDHPEQCAMSRHLGNAALMADRSSWITKEQRLDTSVDLWAPDILRRAAQTEVIGEQLRLEAEVKSAKHDDLGVRKALSLAVPDGKTGPERPLFSESIMRPLRTKYGMRADAPCPFEGLTFDAHLMLTRDWDHLAMFGHQRLLLEEAHSQLSQAEKDSASSRLMDFPWPSNYPRITFDLSRTIGSRYSMDFMRKMFLLVVLTWEDLLQKDLFALLCSFFRLANELMRPVVEGKTLKIVQDLTVQYVHDAKRSLGDKANRPNFHNMLELVFKDLKVYGSAQHGRTGTFEAYHQAPKAAMASTRLLNPEPFALRCDERMDAMRYLLHGGIYRDSHNNRRTLGAGIRGMMDPRKGKTHLPHPLLTAISSYVRPLTSSSLPLDSAGGAAAAPVSLGDAKSSRSADSKSAPTVFVRNGCWFPSKYSWNGNSLRPASLSDGELRILRESLIRDFPEQKERFADHVPLVVVEAKALVDRTSSRSRRLHVQDDVRIQFVDEKQTVVQVARIARLLVVRQPGAHIPYVVPQHFEVLSERCPLRDLQIARQWSLNARMLNRPELLENILEQVLVVHRCKRVCSKHHETKQQFLCACPAVCGARAVCHDHALPACSNATCLATKRTWHVRDSHSTAVRDFLVVDRAHGFITDSKRQQEQAAEASEPT